ncbi:hypothetical protein I5677_05630 [Mobilitalea sibirica]|uniref:Uncharacterized protein n=1 Tax=Mobilitalea sibirica TaxID=1462919 RepID=A0A8J7HAW0_9FIRM|nr:hypothetical protein [Mobilitalea sibirica]MBH1940376.1 hypothetical protein [Mobilitalea sibirica]
MMPLLVFRERVKNFYQRYDIYITPAVKFLFAFIAFRTINNEIGYDARLQALPVVLLLSLLSAFTPSAIMVLLAALLSTLHVYSISPILSIIIVLILLILYFLFARYTPRFGYVMLAVPILYFLKIPYMIPILLGLISTPVAIIPTSCGVIIYFLFQIIKSAVTMQVNITAEEIMQLYKYVIDSLIKNRMMIMTMVVFALILMVTYFVRKMKFDYAFEISIVAGALTSILGFLVSDLIMDNSNQILSMILGTIVSAVIVYGIHFFKLTLDYSGVEHAQFEDDVYYYYVKAVPKITVTTPQVNVKHINVKTADRGSKGTVRRQELDMEEDYDEDDDITVDKSQDYK